MPMLLWSRRSRLAVLIGFGVVVLVVFIAPLATVVIAGPRRIVDRGIAV